MRTLLPLLLLACRPAPATDLPICPAQLVAADLAAEADTRQLPADVWLAILVPGFDRATRTIPDAPKDCARTPLVPPDHTLPARPLTDDDLSFGTAAQSPDAAPELLVWAKLLTTQAGRAYGPVALIRWSARGLEVRGIGALHAPARRVRLHLERLADDQHLLVAEGETCPQDHPPPCPREAVLMPLRAQRFEPLELVEGSRPPRDARLLLDERHDFTGPTGTPRRLEIHRRLDLRSHTPEIHATIRLRDCPRDCTDSLALDDSRPLELIDRTWVTPEDPWLALLATHTVKPTGP
jgi:hypothetical protein